MNRLEYSIQNVTINPCCIENPKYQIAIQFPDEQNQSSPRLFCQTHKNLIESLAKMARIEAKITEVCA